MMKKKKLKQQLKQIEDRLKATKAVASAMSDNWKKEKQKTEQWEQIATKQQFIVNSLKTFIQQKKQITPTMLGEIIYNEIIKEIDKYETATF